MRMILGLDAPTSGSVTIGGCGFRSLRFPLREVGGNDVTKYLPSSAGAAMSAHDRFPDLLPPAGGFGVLAGYALATLAVAMLMISRRDA